MSGTELLDGLSIENRRSARFPKGGQSLAQRADVYGADTLTDVELLGLFVSHCIPDDKSLETADRLMNRFGTLPAVIAASRSALAQIAPATAEESFRGLPPALAIHVAVTREISNRVREHTLLMRPLLSSSQLLHAYLRTTMGHEPREQFRVLFLDNSLGLIANEVMGEGTVGHVPVYAREVVRRALELSANSLILVHNHPSGSQTISTNDKMITVQIVKAAAVMDIQVHDHLIVARNEVLSFKQLGLF